MGCKVSVFLPTRKGSERIINKNTKKFNKFNNGLIDIKINQLIKCKKIDEIVVSTNDEIVIEISEFYKRLDSRISINKRPDNLCLSSTKVSDLIEYVPSVCENDNILWTHVTAPFFSKYDDIIDTYFKNINSYDTIMSVNEHKSFMYFNNKIINEEYNGDWNRTQDLNPFYEINHVFYMTSKKNYINKKNRIGDKIFLYRTSKIESIDIDYNDDFELAEFLATKYLDFNTIMDINDSNKIKEYNKLQKEENEYQIAIDFDGVIHKNSKGFQDGTVYDEPIEGAIDSIKKIYEYGYKIVIFTAKAKSDRPLVNGKTGSELVWEWLKKYDIDKYIKEVTSEKPRALYYIDDKGIRFENWNKINEFLFNSK